VTEPDYFRFSFADSESNRTESNIRLIDSYESSLFGIWNYHNVISISYDPYIGLPFDNGELWNLKSMSGMQAEKEESTLFSNFK